MAADNPLLSAGRGRRGRVASPQRGHCPTRILMTQLRVRRTDRLLFPSMSYFALPASAFPLFLSSFPKAPVMTRLRLQRPARPQATPPLTLPAWTRLPVTMVTAHTLPAVHQSNKVPYAPKKSFFCCSLPRNKFPLRCPLPPGLPRASRPRPRAPHSPGWATPAAAHSSAQACSGSHAGTWQPPPAASVEPRASRASVF